MSSLSLAASLRPKKFADLKGQRQTVALITQALSENRFPHTSLLAGMRGTGKTTVARLVSQSLTCTSRQGVEACGLCPSCLKIKEGLTSDIFELDAASFTGVDHIKELIHTSQLAPQHLTKRIFIIDEAHMLSQSAFNALLKTLEEPPLHSYFILATTELHRIPHTVQSRCHTFIFEPFSHKEMVQTLHDICLKINSEVPKNVLEYASQQSGGSLRDALTYLETIGLKPYATLTSDLPDWSLSLDHIAKELWIFLDQKQLEPLLNLLHSLKNRVIPWHDCLTKLSKWIHEAFLWWTLQKIPLLKKNLFHAAHLFWESPPQTPADTLTLWFQQLQELRATSKLTHDMCSMFFLIAVQNMTPCQAQPLPVRKSVLHQTSQSSSTPSSPSTSNKEKEVSPWNAEAFLSQFFKRLDQYHPFLSARLKHLQILECSPEILIFKRDSQSSFNEIKKQEKNIIQQVCQELKWEGRIESLSIPNESRSWHEYQEHQKNEKKALKIKELENRETYQKLKSELRAIYVDLDESQND